MSPNHDYLPTPDDPLALDDLTLDLLVDGELSPAARRDLLARLDSIPGGWRRCALAFLEAQSWREDFGAISRPPERRPMSPPAQPVRHLRTLHSLGTVAAMAASFLLALGLSFLVRNGWPSAASLETPGPVAAVDKTNEAPALPAPAAEEAMPSRPSNWNLTGGPWETVTLPVSNGADPLELPATERETFDERWWNHLPSAIPHEMLQALEQSGHQVDLRRRLMPFPMKDGRQLVVPVDQVDVHYVGYPTYQ